MFHFFWLMSKLLLVTAIWGVLSLSLLLLLSYNKVLVFGFFFLCRWRGRICSTHQPLWHSPWGTSRINSHRPSSSCFCKYRRDHWDIKLSFNGWKFSQNPCSGSLPCHSHNHHCRRQHCSVPERARAQLGFGPTSTQEHLSLSYKVGSWERYQSLSCFLFRLCKPKIWFL